MSVGFRSWSRSPAVSSQLTKAINPAVGCHYFPPDTRLTPKPPRITARRLVPNYTAWWQRHVCVHNQYKYHCVVPSTSTSITYNKTGRDRRPMYLLNQSHLRIFIDTNFYMGLGSLPVLLYIILVLLLGITHWYLYLYLQQSTCYQDNSFVLYAKAWRHNPVSGGFLFSLTSVWFLLTFHKEKNMF